MARKMPRFVAKEKGASGGGEMPMPGMGAMMRGAGNPVGRPVAAAAKGKAKGKKKKLAKKKGPVARY